jgi:hypothetical protein
MPCEGVCLCDARPVAHVHTAHAQTVDLTHGDYVVPEPDGSGFYPVKPKIFEAKYEEIVE